MSEIKTDLSPNFVRPRRRIRKQILWSLLLMTCLVAATALGKNFLTPTAPSSDLQKINMGDQPIKPRSLWSQIKNLIGNHEKTLAGEAENRVNILLLGIGGKGHEGPELTDTILLLSIKPSTEQLAMVSIPRDLSVEIPGHGFRKINSANAYGEAQHPGSGARLTAQVIEKILGLSIHYYLRLDFSAFQKIVDELGGINIYVDRAFTDRSYPTPSGKNTVLTFEAGWQTMDGQRALQYVRSRQGNNGEGSDFARSRRQQKLILALKEKLISLGVLSNPNRLLSVAEIIRENLQTDIEFWEAQRLFKMARKINYETVISRVIDDNEKSFLKSSFVNGASLLEPRTGDFSPLADFVKNIFDQKIADSSLTQPAVARPRIEIQNGTWTLGLTAKIKKQMEEGGVPVSHITNAASRTVGETVIYDLSRGAYRDTVVKIQEMLGASATTALPTENFKPETQTDILIIVGKDKAI